MLPTFIVTRLPKRKALARVVCIRCGNWFVVNGAAWRRASDYETRSCPFCWKASYIPGREPAE